MNALNRLLTALWITALMTAVPLTGSAQGPQSSAPAALPPAYMVPDFALPRVVSLCGVRFPLENQDVFERLDTELTIAVHGRAQVMLWLKRAARYFPLIERRLKEEGLPDDLKYLAVAESDLRPHVYSPAKALGTWQFIPETGKHYGLKKDQNFDERLNFSKSTDAAMDYLKKLHGDFGNWLLAMAAYNCGEGCVRREIAEQGVNDYFRLNLPTETERYVFRIAAIKIILDNPGQFGYRLAPEHAYRPRAMDEVDVNLAHAVHFTEAAKAIGTDYKVLKEFNPEIKGRYLPQGSYTVRVPAGMGQAMATFAQRASQTQYASDTFKPKPRPQSAASKFYVVKPGDTLTQISRVTGVSVDKIKKLNGMRDNTIQIGQKMKIQ